MPKLSTAFANTLPPIAEKVDLPSSIIPTGKDPTIGEFHPSPTLDDEFDIFGRMSGTGGSSPFIKDEPEDWTFNNPLMSNQHNYNMHGQSFGQGNNSINPAQLNMANHQFFGSQQGNFHMANSGIDDDELLDLESLSDNTKAQGQLHGQHNGGMQDFFQGNGHGNQQQVQHGIYSSTPNGDPIQSPYLGNFNYGNYSQLNQHMSPAGRGNGHGISQDYGFGGSARSRLPHVMDRKPSDSRSPMTPKTPALGGLNLGGTPDSGSLPSQPIHASLNHRHHKSLSGGAYDSTPGSLRSFDSPLASPSHGISAQISEVLKSGKHASLPNKVDTHHTPAYQSQEAKRRRRRESHNMVERRRRDNINERIQELSHLVPQHRLEDEKVRKHLANNGPLSPALAATGMSPPQATSLLAGGGRRATGAGNITMGIPMEDKDKGPNKGDILNGSVGWTRDLMWALHAHIQREAEIQELLTSLGGTWPFQETEDEKRMKTELLDAMDKNDAASFEYSRAHGSGLRVPKHTNLAGEPMGPNMENLSPGVQHNGTNGTNGQYWTNNSSGRGSISFKEEDEYAMVE